MNPRQLVDALEEIARLLHIDIRRDRLETEGGICYLEENPIIVLNKMTPPEVQAKILAQVLSDFDLENIPMRPIVRKFIEDSIEIRNSKESL